MPRRTVPTIKLVDITDADSEYSYTFEDDVQKLLFHMRDSTALRYAFEPGKVATPTDPYMTLAANKDFDEDDLDIPSGTTVYFAAAAGSKKVELLYWTGTRRSS